MSKWEPKEKRVEDIVNSAINVFLDKGYEGASMEAIAREAGMSKGGLYHHFKSKEEILYYVNSKLCDPVTDFMMEARISPEVDQGLSTYIRSYIEYWTDHPTELTFFFLTMTKAMSTPAMWESFSQYYDEVERNLRGLYDKGIQEGIFQNHNSRESSTALLSALDGVVLYLVMNRNRDKEEVITDFINRFVTSLQ